MSTAKIIEISAESTKSYDDAIEKGIAEASQTIDNIRSVWVKDHEIAVSNGSASKHRVHMKVTFVVNAKEA